MAKKSESIAPMASVASGAAMGQAIMPGLCLPPRVSWSENATTCHNSNDQCKIFRRRQLEISVASLGVQRCKGQEAEREPRTKAAQKATPRDTIEGRNSCDTEGL